MAEAKGAKNAYVCQTCRGVVVTINRAEGTTPFMIGCKVTAGCPGLMASNFYRLPENAPEPSIEWVRPSREDRRALSREMRDHVARGGLIPRAIEKRAGVHRLAIQWADFVGHVMPPDASYTQHQEMRRAFYAGARATMALLEAIGDDSVTEDAGVAAMEDLAAELRAFLVDVEAGRA